MGRISVFLATVLFVSPIFSADTAAQQADDTPRETVTVYSDIQEILDKLPRKPERGDNSLASEKSNKWLAANVEGSILKAKCTASSVDRKRVQTKERHTTWLGYDFSLCISVEIRRDGSVGIDKLLYGDRVLLEGTIKQFNISWSTSQRYYGSAGVPLGSPQHGSITIVLEDCKVVRQEKQPAATTTPPKTQQKKITRTWVNADGFTGNAEYVGMIGDTVMLKNSDGTKKKVSLEKLSEEDRQWVKSRTKVK